MDNQLVEELKELLECYDICKDENSYINQEIRMWRSAFLLTNLTSKEIDKTALAQNYFMSLPSEEFMQKTPIEWLEGCKIKLGKK